jgi:hypothetical protein
LLARQADAREHATYCSEHKRTKQKSYDNHDYEKNTSRHTVAPSPGHA